ncbi:ABC transporter permease [Pseudooceanicola sp. CBS1P-1]|uniref:ABC transporter permease subunit n=1 Tax=Pseudooceanicola albus TaxID=2692189 RepID=A0A6L7G7Y7_9RHOB|nr:MULTISPECIES: ABC transporter permease [Pseudooceanicola]MBT9386133.1 ABC transporter permease [Pseudooceanicola endophyticus]MXN19450.1 ABC transporter permease subunit [Pseudooceanicola albus]
MTMDSTAVPARPTRRLRLPRWPVLSLIGAVVFLFWAIIAIFGDWLAPHDPGAFIDSWNVLGPMTHQTWLGTDYLGRDVLSRIMTGAKYTVGLPFVTAGLALFFGLLLGVGATLLSEPLDTALSWLMDTVNSLPSTIFALVAVAGFGTSIPVLIIVITALYIPSAYRNVRAAALNVSRMEYIDAARVRGEGHLHVIFREILPNIVPNMLTHFGIMFIYIALLLSGLSFLGLGVQPPEADWGALISENMVGLSYGAPAIFAPALSLLSLTIAMTLMVDAVSHQNRER